MAVKFTAKQKEALTLISSDVRNTLFRGGGRSSKTFTFMYAVITRALKVKSRHLVARKAFQHCKQSLWFGTFEAVIAICYPELVGKIKDNKDLWFKELPNGSQIWFGGLDDKERVDKILGNEYATIFLNEVSEISWDSVETVMTRLAQKTALVNKLYLDCNPTSTAHWTYQVFFKNKMPSTGKNLTNPEQYQELQMNPIHNLENIDPNYVKELENASERKKQRFLLGEYADDVEIAVFREEKIKYWRKRPERIIGIYQSWDTAFKKDEHNDPSVCLTWAIAEEQVMGLVRHETRVGYYLLDIFSKKMDYPELKRAAAEQADKWRPDAILIEDAASGQCYDDKTEVLTKSGWKFFKDVNLEIDEFATRSLGTKEFQWQKATNEYHADYNGDMYHFYGKTHDLMVTPNHRMLVNTLPKKMGGCSKWRTKGEEVVITAEDLVKHGLEKTKTPMKSIWQGKEIITKELSPFGYIEHKNSPAKSIVLQGDDYIKFMAMYLAEGWTQVNVKHRLHAVFIGQYEKSKSYKVFCEVLTGMGTIQKRRGKEIYLTNKKLYEFVRQYGLKCDTKIIPLDIMNSTPRQLKIFWDFYMMGDGHITKKGHSAITTTSPVLAGQLQEIAQKMGYSASIGKKVVPPKPFRIGKNKNLTLPENLKPSYIVRLRTSNAQKLNPHKIRYNGTIHCVTVPNGIIYVRRNGFPSWCGNSLIQDLQNNTPLVIIPCSPQRQDKVTRAMYAADFVDRGMVYFPMDNEMVDEYRAQLLLFPFGEHDDYVDATSQFFKYVKNNYEQIQNRGEVDIGEEIGYIDAYGHYDGACPVTGY